MKATKRNFRKERADQRANGRFLCQAFDVLVSAGAHRATKYIRPDLVLRATRRLYRKKVMTKGPIEVLITIGRPNYREREVVKLLKQAREPFPVRKVVYQMPPQPRAKARKRTRAQWKRTRAQCS